MKNIASDNFTNEFLFLFYSYRNTLEIKIQDIKNVDFIKSNSQMDYQGF